MGGKISSENTSQSEEATDQIGENFCKFWNLLLISRICKELTKLNINKKTQLLPWQEGEYCGIDANIVALDTSIPYGLSFKF